MRTWIALVLAVCLGVSLGSCSSRQPPAETQQDKKPASVKKEETPRTDFELAYVEGDHGGKFHRFFIKDSKKIAALLQWHSEIMKARPVFSTAGMPCKPEIIISLFKSAEVADDPEHFKKVYTEVRDSMMLIYESMNCVDERKVTQEDLTRLYEILGLQ